MDNQADLSSDTAARQKREADNPKYTKACAKAKRGCIPLGSIIDSLQTANTVTPSTQVIKARLEFAVKNLDSGSEDRPVFLEMLEACRKVLRIEERRKRNIKDWDRTLGNHPEVMNLNSEEREEQREGLLQLERGLGSSSEVLNQAATQERIDDDFPPFVTDRDLNNFEEEFFPLLWGLLQKYEMTERS